MNLLGALLDANFMRGGAVYLRELSVRPMALIGQAKSKLNRVQRAKDMAARRARRAVVNARRMAG